MDEKEKKKIVLWGTGKYGVAAFSDIDTSKCCFTHIIDTDKEKIGRNWNGHVVEDTSCLFEDKNIDYLVISVKNSLPLLDTCKKLGIEENKIVDYSKTKIEYDWISFENLRIIEKALQEEYTDAIDRNLVYETGTGDYHILNGIECLKRIQLDNCSLARFGDGEFEMILEEHRPWFQEPNHLLSQRLMDVLSSNNRKLLIAIPDQFGNLEKYTETAANDIRVYMGKSREKINRLLDSSKIYYDAYVSRPYLIYKDKENASHCFSEWKLIWQDREVVIIEGPYVRNGVGNDLLSSAKSIERIICPSKNAFDIYDTILNWIKQNVSKNKLILISLGPTATVLVYDLFNDGYQAVDIGQLDNEYEWFLAGAQKREHIKNKAVPELTERNVMETEELTDYDSQIIVDLSSIER